MPPMLRRTLILALAALACHARPAGVALPESALAPHLLEDRAEIARYLAEFPADDYDVIDAPDIGQVYVDRGLHDSIKDQLRSGKTWEPHLIALMAKHVRPGSTVLDVGAHIGTHSLRLGRLVGPKGRVYAFEPQRKIFRELTYNVRLNRADNVIPLRYAAGDHEEIVHMSPATPGNEGGTAIGEGGDAVELRTIDGFGFRDVSLIKIDVEGFEDPVLDGARATIRKYHPFLVVEIQAPWDPATAPPEIQAKIAATKARIEAMGYEVAHYGDAPWDYFATPVEPR
jgi:FkbM family methyltransferase